MAKTPHPGKLILVRHTESEWNVLGKWTGLTNVHLTDKGRGDAKLVGKALRDHKIDKAYSSELVRTQETLDDVLAAAEQTKVPRQVDALLNERDYGDYTGLNKWDVQTELGEDVFHQVRRSWDYPIPNGETLQVLHGRLVPFYEEQILPQLRAGKTVLLVSHGNPLRALIKHLESISDKDIAEVEMPFGHVLIYTVRPDGRVHHKEHRIVEVTATHA